MISFIGFKFSERFRRLFKEGFWIMLGQALAVLGSLAGVRLLTELLDPTAYGELALGLTAATLVNQIVLGPLGNGVSRFYAPALEKGDLASYLNTVRRLVSLVTGIIVFMILLVVAGLIIVKRPHWAAIAFAAFLFAILSGHNSILNGIQNAARQRSVVALHQGIESWARFLVASGLLLLLGATSTIAMFGYALAASLALGSQYFFFKKLIPEEGNASIGDRNWSEKIWKYSWPFAAWGIFTWAQQVSDRWALGVFTTTDEVGLYSVLFQLGYYPISIVTGISMQFIAPIFFQRAGDGTDPLRRKEVSNLSWKITWLALSVTGAAFFVTLFFHGQIFGIFVAREYAEVSHFLPWVLLGGGVFAAGQSIALNLMSQMKTNAIMVAKIATAILGIALNLFGAYFFGIAGIVVAGVFFSISYLIYMLFISKNRN